MNTVIKIVRETNRRNLISFSPITPAYQVQYRDRKVFKMPGTVGLLCFSTLMEARLFLGPYIESSTQIWQAETEDDPRPVEKLLFINREKWAQDGSIRGRIQVNKEMKAWGRNVYHPVFTWLAGAPRGTVAVDSLRLTRRLV